MASRPIADYALLSDRHSAALVSRDGSVDWLCFPRFDSPSLFAALLDPDAAADAGRWSIHPTGPHTATRGYLADTMVLQTRFQTASGTVTVTDALATGGNADPHALGAAAPHLLIRVVTCTDGTVEVAVEFRPRPEYGLVTPLLAACDGGVAGRDGRRVAVLVGRPPGLPGAVAGPGAPLRSGAARVELPADRRHRRRGHHLPAGNRRRRT